METIHLVKGNDPWLRAASCYVRMDVFVFERGLSAKAEFDSFDLPETYYAVLFDGNKPVATARLLHESTSIARITRVATLKDYRGKSYGRQVIEALEDCARSMGSKQIVIHSELSAVPFYKKLTYQETIERYDEDGIPCQTLIKTLKEPTF